MKIVGLILCVVLMGVALPAGAAEGAKALDEAFVKAINANDAAALTALYAPDAVVFTPFTMEFKGIDAIRKDFEALVAGNVISDFKILESSYETSGDLSAGWGLFSMTITPKNGGTPQPFSGRFTSVAKKIGGKWLYIADQGSGVLSSAPAPSGKN